MQRGDRGHIVVGLLAVMSASGCSLPRTFITRADAMGDTANDAGFDASTDAGFDAGTDVSTDASNDAGFDAGTDAKSDADFDASTDAGPPVCGLNGVNFVTHIAVGDLAACALRCDGMVYCWGANDYGQLVDPNYTGSAIPLPISHLQATDIVAGAYYFCAIDTQGRVVCWGSNYYRQLGVDSGDASVDGTLRVVPGISGTVALAAGEGTTCAWTSNGVLYCWGENDRGQAGAAASPTGVPPTPVNLPPTGGQTPTVVSVAMGQYHGCASRGDGTTWTETYCWGETSSGQTGASGASGFQSPMLVSSSVAFGDLMGGDLFSLALPSGSAASPNGGTMYCWGTAPCAEQSFGTLVPTPMQVPTVSLEHLARSSGYRVRHACGVLAGTVYCWGANDRGQAHGMGGESVIYPATPVRTLTNVQEVAAGRQNTCALAHGEVYCWGGAGSNVLGPDTGLDLSVDGDRLSVAFSANEYRIPVPTN